LLDFYGPGAIAALVAGGLITIKVSPDAVNYVAGAVVQGAVAAEGVRRVAGRVRKLRTTRNEDSAAGTKDGQQNLPNPSRSINLVQKGTAAAVALAGGFAAYRLSPEPEFLRTVTSTVGEGTTIYFLGAGTAKAAIYASDWVGDKYTGIKVNLHNIYDRNVTEGLHARCKRQR